MKKIFILTLSLIVGWAGTVGANVESFESDNVFICGQDASGKEVFCSREEVLAGIKLLKAAKANEPKTVEIIHDWLVSGAKFSFALTVTSLVTSLITAPDGLGFTLPVAATSFAATIFLGIAAVIFPSEAEAGTLDAYYTTPEGFNVFLNLSDQEIMNYLKWNPRFTRTIGINTAALIKMVKETTR